MKELRNTRDLIKKEHGDAELALAKSRFWIGDEAYYELTKFVSLINEDYADLALTAEKDPEAKQEFAEIERRRNELRSSMTGLAKALWR